MTEGEEESRVYELAKCGCDCWFCPDCCERKGYNLRAELIPVLETFTGLMMLTLTIDPELFPSPKDAYLYVRKQRAISRLMRELDREGHLHSRRYFYVVEFQERTEQAHFHVLIDATRVPKWAIDDAWSKFRPRSAGPVAPNRPAFGITRFSVSRFEGGAEHAGRYATKYLVKTPAHGWPAWVMQMGRDQRVPRYQTSRGFWNRDPKPATSGGDPRELNPRTYADRVIDCGAACNLFAMREVVDESTGEVLTRREWVSRLAIDSGIIEIIEDDERASKRRTTILAGGPHGALAAIQRAAGRPVQVISGLGFGRAAG